MCVCGVGVFVDMLTMVALCEKTNLNPLLWVKFYGLDHMFRRGLVGVILKINLVHVLKVYQIMHSMLIVVFGHLNSLNKFFHCGQSCRELQYLSLDTKITLIAHVFL